MQSKCEIQNCENCTISSNICTHCNADFELSNNTCIEIQVASNSMLVIILAIGVPAVFTILFCIA